MQKFDVNKVINYVKLNTGRKTPTYVLYYSFNVSAVNSIIVGSTAYESYNGQLFSDSNLTIKYGKMATTYTMFDLKNSDNNNLFESNSTNVLHLPEGTIQNFQNTEMIKNNNGQLILPPNIITINTIICGTNKYFGKNDGISNFFFDRRCGSSGKKLFPMFVTGHKTYRGRCTRKQHSST